LDELLARISAPVGYGGSTTALDQLAGKITASGGTLGSTALTTPHSSDCRSLQTLGLR